MKKTCAELSDEVDDLQGRLKAALEVNERNSSTLESLEKHNHKLRHRMERSTTMCEELEVCGDSLVTYHDVDSIVYSEY